MPQQIIQNGETGLNVRTSLNEMFFELFSASNVPLIIENISGNYETVAIPANSFLDSIGINASSNTTIQIGTTAGGSDLLSSIAINGFQLAVVQTLITTISNIYITFVSGSGPVNFRFNIINNYL